MDDACVAPLAARGYADVRPAAAVGTSCAFLARSPEGVAVVARLRVGAWETEAVVWRKVSRAYPATFPPLLDTFPVDGGALLVYECGPGQELADLLEDAHGILPYPVLLRLCEGIAHSVALFHALRLFTGTLSLRYELLVLLHYCAAARHAGRRARRAPDVREEPRPPPRRDVCFHPV